MKKRVLFVDDEPMILEGLKRMLRSMRAEWEMEFVESGESALCLLGQKPFDVIVSDMRMPRMNGAELLAEVMKRHPNMVRLILSGYADKDLILKCVGSTHQYLAKPCDAETLKATISRASNLEDSVNSQRLKTLVCKMDHLPSIPTLYVQVVEKASRADVSIEEIGDIIGRDIGMTAQVLKLANSAFFGLPRHLASAEEAVAYLGLDTIKSLVLSIHAFSQFEKAETGTLKMETLWSHSLQVASLAKRISNLEVHDAKSAEEAFTAGMLHDIGKLVLAVNLPNEYTEAIRLAQSGMAPPLAEHEVFGTNHADVGGYLIGLWGLPVPVVEAVALHHFPSRAPQPSFSPLTSVYAANVLEHERSNSSQPTPAPQWDADYLSLVGVWSHLDDWRHLQAENETSYEHRNSICR
ncbi:MAG TPA: response regulator [Candidatus Baltobacteraceae bacterium]|jgi:HD-like signal output (HDOD) protein|nr:response regulator [Candidatus Baltobacteraceae bacterium]